MARSRSHLYHLAETLARRSVEGWIALYGCPSTVMTDGGQKSEADRFSFIAAMVDT